jgi:hypothetical protein
MFKTITENMDSVPAPLPEGLVNPDPKSEAGI